MKRQPFAKLPFALRLLVLTATSAPSTIALAQAATPAVKRPNILLIVADDLGYSDLGAFGSEIQTPRLDALARHGRVLRNFYAAPTCSPTRSILLSGTDNHLAGLGSMAEELAPEQEGKPGYEGYLDARVAPLPALLQDAGYRTYQAGKWHLGGDPAHRPNARGFQHSFALVQGGASHFKQQVGALFPGAPQPIYLEDDAAVSIPDSFFSSTAYTNKLIQYIDAERGSDKPFFGYLTYTAPHWPIQAPDANLARVRGRYDAGYEAIAEQRFARQKRLGLAAPDAPRPPLPPGIRPWAALNAAERARSARTFEAYAAAIEALDENVGRVIDYLKSSGQFDNTFIFFLADNGAEGNDISLSAEPGGTEAFQDWLAANFDNRLENIGHRNSYTWIGEAWGQTSALPNRLYKGNVTEGGIRTPAFVHFPKHIAAGATSATITARDVLPTLLELAGTRHPGLVFRGAPVLPVQGNSILPHLTGEESTVHNADYAFGTELFGRSALRKGDWKIVRLYAPVGDGAWQLFNLADDPGELVDLVKLQPRSLELRAQTAAKLVELQREWRQYVNQNNVIELGYDNGYGYGPLDTTP
jgi:arylsulfatase